MAAWLLAGSNVAQAQTSPAAINPGAIGAGLIEQQRQQPLPPPPQKSVLGNGMAPDAVAPAAEGVVFTLQSVTFDSSAFLKPSEVQALAAPLIGTQVSLVDLRLLAAKVNALYAARGIVTARAYVPPQKIVEGAVRMALIEGRLGELKIAEGHYTGSAYVRPRIPLATGEIVDLTQLRQKIEVFNRSNDVRLQAQLQPGAQVGLTDVLIAIAEPPRNSAQFFVDTYGYDSTGRNQGGFSLKHNALLFDGDRANIYASFSDGGVTGSASYNVPVGGARMGLTYARSQIHITQGPSASLDIRGYTDTGSVNLARPVFSGDNWYAGAVSAFSYSGTRNALAGKTVGKTKVYKATGGVSFGYDRSSNVSLGVNLTASFADTTDSLETDRRTFGLFNGDLAASLALAPRFSIQMIAAAQYSTARLVPSNQLFQLGGINSVRGFQPGTASGSSGFFDQMELHYALPVGKNGLDMFGFVDTGKSFSFDFGDRGIAAAGGGLRFTFWRVHLEAIYAAPISGRRPNEGKGRTDARLTLNF